MKILLLTNIPPYPAHKDGGGQRTSLLFRSLSHLGEVSLMIVSRPGFPYEKTIEELECHWPLLGIHHWKEEVPPPPSSRWLLRKIRSFLWYLKMDVLEYQSQASIVKCVSRELDTGKYDLVVGRYLRPSFVAGLPGVAINRDKPIPVIIDVDDFDASVIRSSNKQFSRLKRFCMDRRANMLEFLFYRRSRGVSAFFFSNPSDVILCQRKRRVVTALPNIPYFEKEGYKTLQCVAMSKITHPVILFVGNLKHTPNVSGLDWFLEQVWPTILEKEPGTVLQIVGNHLSNDLRMKWESFLNVDVLGFVDSLTQSYNDAWFSICPSQWGGGSNIKVLESLIMGRTCVVSEYSFKAHSPLLEDGKDLIVGRSAMSFAKGCLKLIQNRNMRQECAESGFEKVRKECQFDGFSRKIHKTIKYVMDKNGGKK